MSALIIGALGCTGLILCLFTVVTARPPGSPIVGFDAYGAIWQRQHMAPDVDPTHGVVGVVLRLTHTLATPLARRGLNPGAITLWGLWLAAVAAGTAGLAQRWPLLAATVVLGSVLVDGVDGCVAGLTNRATRRGFVLDSMVDRLSDALFAVALVRAGGRTGAAVSTVSALMMLEYLRARAGNAGKGDVGMVTVGERPTRAVAAIVGLGAVGIHPGRAPGIATASLIVIAALSAVGFIQLAWHLGRTLDR